MKVKLFNEQKSTGEISNMMVDRQALETNILSYKNWIRGTGIRADFSTVAFAKNHHIDNKYQIKSSNGLTIANRYDKIMFSVSDNTSKKEWIFVDIDIKAINKPEEELEDIKTKIINEIKNDYFLSQAVYSVVRSGVNMKSGLHILLKGDFPGKVDRSKSLQNFVTYLKICLNKENVSLDDKGVIDTSSLTDNRLMKASFGIGFEYLNELAVWKDFDFTTVEDYIDVPTSYESGFHNRFNFYLNKTNSTLEELLVKHSNDLTKQPFSTSKTFEEELKRLYQYKKAPAVSNVQVIPFLYLDTKGQQKVDLDKLSVWLNKTYDKTLNGGVLFSKLKGTKIWKTNYKTPSPSYFELSLIIKEKFSYLGATIATDICNKVNQQLNQSPDIKLPKRDSDTHDQIVFNINNGTDYLSIRVKKDNVEFIHDKEYLDGNTTKMNFKRIDLKYDYTKWDVWQKGFFHNIVGENRIDKLIDIIGCGAHMDIGNNSSKFIFLSDASNDVVEQAGSGKSTLAKIITRMRSSSTLRYPEKNTSSKFIYQKLERHTQAIIIDEFPPHADIEVFRPLYGEKLDVEKKNQGIFEIDPVKLIICSNYGIKESTADLRRRVQVSFTNHYNKDNPLDKSLGYFVFEKRLYEEDSFESVHGNIIDSNEWWNGYIAFMIHCAQSYLIKNTRGQFIDSIINNDDVYNKKELVFIENYSYYSTMIETLKKILDDPKEFQVGDKIILKNTDLFSIYDSYNRPEKQNLAPIPHMMRHFLNKHFPDITYKKGTRNSVVAHILTKDKKK